MMMSIIRSMIKTHLMFFTKTKVWERDGKTNKFFSSSSSVVLRRRSTTNNERKTDRHSFFFFFFSLFLPCTDERTKRRRSQGGKREAAFFIILLLKFVRAQKSVRISFRPVLSVVVALKDRRLSFRRRMWWEKKKYTHARARREKIRIYAIVPLSAMISSSSSESTSIVVVICDESSNRCKSPIRLSLLFCRKFFLFVHFLFWGV